MHHDLVARQFTAAGPDRVWLTDITEHPTGEGKLCGLAVPGDPGGEPAGCPGEKAPTIAPGLRP